jgi:hypothetical protein
MLAILSVSLSTASAPQDGHYLGTLATYAVMTHGSETQLLYNRPSFQMSCAGIEEASWVDLGIQYYIPVNCCIGVAT